MRIDITSIIAFPNQVGVKKLLDGTQFEEGPLGHLSFDFDFLLASSSHCKLTECCVASDHSLVIINNGTDLIPPTLVSLQTTL